MTKRCKHLEAVLCARKTCVSLVVNCELLEKWTDEPAYHLISSSIPSNCIGENQARHKGQGWRKLRQILKVVDGPGRAADFDAETN